MHYADPVSLYIITQPNDKARLRPLVRIVVNMIVRLLADKMEFENGRPKATYKHKLLAMIDEFPALGKLEILQEGSAFVAVYGIKSSGTGIRLRVITIYFRSQRENRS
jgi:type IV secretion system protein VirD4